MFKLFAIETLQCHENLYLITEGMTDYQRRAVGLRRARYESGQTQLVMSNKTVIYNEGRN